MPELLTEYEDPTFEERLEYRSEQEVNDKALVQEVNEEHGLTDDQSIASFTTDNRVKYAKDIATAFRDSHGAEASDHRHEAAATFAREILSPLAEGWNQDRNIVADTRELQEKILSAIERSLVEDNPAELAEVLNAAVRWGGDSNDPNGDSGLVGSKFTTFANLLEAHNTASEHPYNPGAGLINALGYRTLLDAIADHGRDSKKYLIDIDQMFAKDHYGAESPQYEEASARGLFHDRYQGYMAKRLSDIADAGAAAEPGSPAYNQAWSDFRETLVEPARRISTHFTMTMPNRGEATAYTPIDTTAQADDIHGQLRDQMQNIRSELLRAVVTDIDKNDVGYLGPDYVERVKALRHIVDQAVAIDDTIAANDPNPDPQVKSPAELLREEEADLRFFNPLYAEAQRQSRAEKGIQRIQRLEGVIAGYDEHPNGITQKDDDIYGEAKMLLEQEKRLAAVRADN